MIEPLYTQSNVDEKHFQQVIGDGICFVSSISHSDYNAKSLFISVSKIFFEWFNVNQDYSVSNH